jgi:secondary thiamine-phosphate synthase enzyme
MQEGLCLVNAMHITASVFINDDERGLHQDCDDWLEELAPHEPISKYRQNRTGEDNADAHMKRQIMGREVVVAITNGRLHFGPWEQILYEEFDCGRRKPVLVKIIGGCSVHLLLASTGNYNCRRPLRYRTPYSWVLLWDKM